MFAGVLVQSGALIKHIIHCIALVAGKTTFMSPNNNFTIMDDGIVLQKTTNKASKSSPLSGTILLLLLFS